MGHFVRGAIDPGHRVSGVLLFTFLAVLPAFAQPTVSSVVDAAGYGPAIAPDSLATIFGSNLSQGTASATLDSNGQLPTVLASISVTIGGVSAPLVYASPGQINLVVPSGLTAGTANVVVRSTTFGTTATGTALIRDSAPGVFTNDAGGSGSGAILNAVTFQPAPFLVQTGSGNGDLRTRLAVYATGLRHSGTVTAQARDSSGNGYPLTVEYSGAAPDYFGLDQVNVLLPPDLDGAGTVSLSLFADNYAANVVTFQMDQLPASSLRMATLTLSAAYVSAGDSTILTVGLNGVARSGGFVVGLRTDNTAAQVATQIAIPQGHASAQTTVTTSGVPARASVPITAQAGGQSLSVSLAIDPANTAQLGSLSTSVASILGGKVLTGTVNLTGNAPAGGVNVLLSSDSSKVQVPSSVSVPYNASSATFSISTLAVTGSVTATLTATLSRNTATTTLTVLPPLQLTLDANAVVGGNSVTGTVTLAEPAPVTGALVTMQSSDASVDVSPVSLASGQTVQTFTLTTSAVSAARTVTITASYNGNRQTAELTVNPVSAGTLSSLTISPDHVSGGSSTQGTVTFSAPTGAGGVVVNLRSSSTITASAPGFVTVPQGKTSATFTITTSRITGIVTFTATAGGIAKTADLTVQ